jgi:hypothetical protein
MDATQRIIEEFDRLVALGRDAVAARPLAERILFYVVVARCEKDMAGFSSIFLQALTAGQLAELVEGLRTLDEPRLASAFASGLEALTAHGFYVHQDWNRVSAGVKAQIEAIGDSIGDEFWDLDEKLVALLDGASGAGKRSARVS